MDWGRIFFIFFSLVSLTSTISFLLYTNVVLLFLAVSINFIATTLLIGTKRVLSSELFASFLVADFHLIPSFMFYQVLGDLDITYALTIGALVANTFAIVIIIVESSKTRDTYY